MKMKIAILGSTGSIGKSTLDVIRKDKIFFDPSVLMSHTIDEIFELPISIPTLIILLL